MNLTPIYVLGGMGIAFGIGLAYLSKRFEVEPNAKVIEIRNLLPGANCGSCGYAGCDAFAEAVALNDEDFKKCAPGKARHNEIAKALGKEANCSTDRSVATLLCGGGAKAGAKSEYRGEMRCSSAVQISGGPKLCSYGCIGYGDCVKVCPVDAIKMGTDGLPAVDENLCISCGKCVGACPKKLFALIPAKSKVSVKCVSKDMAKDVAKNCKVGCIACRICEKTCKFDAIHVTGNIAAVDYAKCTNCGACVEKCPRKIIVKKS
jgi:Na+-translocating ferredoxin:NAD+ oxidoreductase subunit B